MGKKAGKAKDGKSTQQYRDEAHEALHPLWHACHDELMARGEEIDLPSFGRMTRQKTPQGAEIHRLGSVIMVSGIFEKITQAGRPASEHIEIVFPEDISDLSRSAVSWMLYVGENFGDEGISGGSVAVRNFPQHAAAMLELVAGNQIEDGQQLAS